MTKARDLASLLSGSGSGTIAPALVSDQANTSTGYFAVPKGTQGQRPATGIKGMLRYNDTADVLEQYSSEGWVGIEPAPTVSAVAVPSGLSAITTGDSVTVTGTGFKTGVVCKFIHSGGTNYIASTTTRNSSTEIVAVLPSGMQDGVYQLIVANPSGLAGTFDNAFTHDDAPVFSTSGSLGTFTMRDNLSISIGVTETGSTPTLTLQSGTLPSGLSISGLTLTGVLSDVSADITHNFVLRATDAEGQYADLSCTLTVEFVYFQDNGALLD